MQIKEIIDARRAGDSLLTDILNKFPGPITEEDIRIIANQPIETLCGLDGILSSTEKEIRGKTKQLMRDLHPDTNLSRKEMAETLFKILTDDVTKNKLEEFIKTTNKPNPNVIFSQTLFSGFGQNSIPNYWHPTLFNYYRPTIESLAKNGDLENLTLFYGQYINDVITDFNCKQIIEQAISMENVPDDLKIKKLNLFYWLANNNKKIYDRIYNKDEFLDNNFSLFFAQNTLFTNCANFPEAHAFLNTWLNYKFDQIENDPEKCKFDLSHAFRQVLFGEPSFAKDLLLQKLLPKHFKYFINELSALFNEQYKNPCNQTYFDKLFNEYKKQLLEETDTFFHLARYVPWKVIFIDSALSNQEKELLKQKRDAQGNTLLYAILSSPKLPANFRIVAINALPELINIQNSQGETPLEIALKNANTTTNIVDALIKGNADISIFTPEKLKEIGETSKIPERSWIPICERLSNPKLKEDSQPPRKKLRNTMR